jgi:hypothetical protein
MSQALLCISALNTRTTEQVIDWLDMSEAERPSIITLYFEGVDTAGHAYGPWAAEVESAMLDVDSAIGKLLDAIDAPSRAAIAERVHIVLVSDHGMTEISPSRTIHLEDYIDLSDLERDWGSPAAMFYIKQGREAEVCCDIATRGALKACHIVVGELWCVAAYTDDVTRGCVVVSLRGCVITWLCHYVVVSLRGCVCAWMAGWLVGWLVGIGTVAANPTDSSQQETRLSRALPLCTFGAYR